MELYDTFSPVALRQKVVVLSGSASGLAPAIGDAFRSVGARLVTGPPGTAAQRALADHGSVDCLVSFSAEGPDGNLGGASRLLLVAPATGLEAIESSVSRLVRGGVNVNGVAVAGDAGEAAMVALFLACEGSRGLRGAVLQSGGVNRARVHPTPPVWSEPTTAEVVRPGPFGLYDTFSPTVLRGRAVLMDGVPGPLTAALVIEFARAGARVAVCSAPDEAIGVSLREARAMGREARLLPEAADPKQAAASAVAQVLAAYGRLDVLVSGPGSRRGAYFSREAGRVMSAEGAAVNLVHGGSKGEPPGGVEALLRESRQRGVRLNTVALDDAAVPQDAAWVALFLASPAGRSINAHWLPLG